MDHEGKMVGEWLSGLGYDVFVLRYRVSTKEEKFYYPTQLNDVKALVRIVQKKYKTFGVMGFSAGGHLAGSYLTDKKNKAAFGILMYPVISTDSSFWHRGSFNNLLGPDYRNLATEQYSIDKNISKKTPPLFFVHTVDDKTVPVKNSEVAFEASRLYQPLSELHIYEKGGHGFGMRPVNDALAVWKDKLQEWLKHF
jgi:acetyl esterase/lipase